MPAIALGFALAAAGFHALWNLLLARARDVESATAVALITAEVVFAPVAVVVWRADSSVWPWLVGSGLFEIVYFALLSTAYRKAPLSVVYPVARGGAPVLVLIVGVVALGHDTSWRQAGAVLLVVAGVLFVRGVGRADPGAVAFGLAIASCIAGYTLIDKQGIRYAGPITYLELSMIGPTIVYVGAVLRLKGGAAIRAEARPPAIVAGIATFVAYALVLAALQRAAAASVAAVRETSVVVATVLAAVVLKEQVSAWRFAGAVLVVCGVALLATA
jgi:drug/metabolite transporter (DMT)-like permease